MTLDNGQKVVALDFDGVLHDYHGWNGGTLAGPIPGMRTLVYALAAGGAEVVVFTTRPESVVIPWLREYDFPALDVINEKWSRIDVFVDDRAQEFSPAFVRDAEAAEKFAAYLLAFQPYWRRS